MLCKWKSILTNWNNCYFNDTKTEECITINTLLTIISHLHKNLNLDESKSSILEAQTIEDFILEKYPEFRFGNGTVEPTNEEEVYMVASLLLYFVCVNSKEVDIKQAMCSKLSPEDQEIIMKFSKCLMEYASVTYKDVQAAILEACGQDIAAGEKVPSHPTVTETPPALRSLHGEVRRLQAALDAERFDRNYLQEELARTNLRMEKLQKDKQQYKLDIMDLKARICMSGGEGEVRGAAGEAEDMTRLRRQLHDAEERLIQAQEQLEDAVHHRDAFKAKMEELKHDRDKWLSVSQEETTRAVQLADELETERRRVHSLQELVAELRQHHQNNCLDGSQLECDDPDASLHSLHNASVCSEACANVIEVQLGEERAKIVVLKQQIQALQEQLQDLDQKYEDEKLSLEEVINQKDNNICDLKHRINEEIEEKNFMRLHYSDEISKLNNDINELEQKLKENAETSRTIIEQKIQEVQTLQEEKLSLLQSLSDEINKFEDVIKHLKTDLDTEKNLKHKMKEDYENKFMKMNEKVLNRNNELVELQNKIFEQSEQIEQLNLDLKKEKECCMNLTNKHNEETRLLNETRTAIETSLHQKTEEAKELQRRLIQNVSVFAELNKEIDDLKFVNESLTENQQYLQAAKDSLVAEIQQRDYDVQGIRKEIENITDIFGQEKKRFTTKLEEKNAIINTLQTRLHDQTKYKTVLEDELKQLRDTKVALSRDIAKLYQDFSTLKVEVKEKDRAMYALDLYLKEERHTNKNLKAGIEKLFEEVMLLTEDVTIKNQEVGNLDEKLESVAESFKQVLLKKQEALEVAYKKLQTEMDERNMLQETFSMMGAEMDSISKDYTTRCDELAKLQDEYDRLALSTAENVSVIETLGNQIVTETEKYSILEREFDTQTSDLLSKLNDAEKTIKEITAKSKKIKEDKELQTQTLKLEIENLRKHIEENSNRLEILDEEKKALIVKLGEEAAYRVKIEEEYNHQTAVVDNITVQLNNVILAKSEEIKALKDEIVELNNHITMKSEEINTLHNTISQLKNEVTEKTKEIKTLQDNNDQLNKNISLKSNEITVLKQTIVQLNENISLNAVELTSLKDTISQLNQEMDFKLKEITSLNDTIVQQGGDIALQSEEIIIKKNKMNYLNSEVNTLKNTIAQLNGDILLKDEEINTMKNSNAQLGNEVSSRLKEITDLQATASKIECENTQKSKQITELQKIIAQLNDDIVFKNQELTSLQNKIIQLNEEMSSKSDEIESLKDTLNQCNNDIHSKNNALFSLETEIARKAEEIITLKNCNDDLKCQLESKHEQFDILEKEIETLTEQTNHKMEDLTTTQDSLSKTIITTQEMAYQKDMMIKELMKDLENSQMRNQQLDVIKKELSIQNQSIEALQKENELLQFTIEEENSNHELIVNEKDTMIERLEEHLKVISTSLESVRKDFESKTLLWEKSKFETQEKLESKDHQLVSLNAQINELNEILEQHKITEKELKKQIELVNKEIDAKCESQMTDYNQQLAQYEMQIASLKLDVENLRDELESEKNAKDIIEQQNEDLLMQKEVLVQELKQEKCKAETLEVDKSAAIDETKVLAQELLQQKLMLILEKKKIDCLFDEKQTLEKQVKIDLQALSAEKQKLLKQLEDEKASKEHLDHGLKLAQRKENSLEEHLKGLNTDKELLEKKIYNLIELKDNLEQERDLLLLENNNCYEKIKILSQQVIEESEAKNIFSQKLNALSEDLEEEKFKREMLSNEKESLHNDNFALNNNILELNAIQELVLSDKEILLIEKEQLSKNLCDEKAARDELESEKSALTDILQEAHEKYEKSMKDTKDQLSVMSTELINVKTEFKKHEDFNVYVTSVLSSGLERLLKSIKKEEIGNEVLQKLISMNEEDNMPVQEKCDLLIKIAETLTIELSLRKNLEKDLKYENDIVSDLKEIIKNKELQVLELQTEVKKLQQAIQENQIEFTKQTETYNTTVDSKIKDIQKLQNENKTLTNELNDVKVQLEVKVHSLKEKLVDNENLTDKLKKTYECQIENLNVMVNKLSSYLKEKTMELELVRRDKEKLQQHVDEMNGAIKSLEEELKNQKLNQQKLIDDFEAERQVLKNMVSVTESIMEDQKITLNKTIADQEKTVETLQAERNSLEQLNEVIKKKSDELVQEKQVAFDSLFKELAEARRDKERKEKDFQMKEDALNKEISTLKEELAHKQSSVEFLEFQNKVLKKEKEQYQKDTECEIHRLNEQVSVVETLENANKDLTSVVNKLQADLLALEEKDNELKIKKDSLETELLNRIDKLSKVLSEDHAKNDKFKSTLQEKLQAKTAVQEKVKVLTDEIIDLVKEKNAYISKLDEVKAECDTNEIKAKEKIEILTEENERLAKVTEGNKSVIANLEQVVQHELKRNQKLQEDYAHEKLNLESKCSVLQQYQLKAQKQLQERDREISSLKEQVKTKAHYEDRIENLREEIANKDRLIAKIAEDKDEVIKTLSTELFNEKERYHKEMEERTATISVLRQKLEEVRNELKKENDEMIKVIGQRETFAVASQTFQHKLSSQTEKELRDRHQVSTPTSDLTHSSMESFKTITDLEKIIHDKNRTITTLQSDITYLKSLMADSENKLLDVTKELDMAKENCDQLSSQLKKIVQQKNEEISDLKRQLTKMSVTENRASQIIKVSAKYQAIILKRIAEIKSNTILKELTNFGNVANCEPELKRSLTTGAITMEDLENFLETTDRHLKRCSEKQTALQKERDRLVEVNKINESEIINLKKFLTELSVCFKTFNSIKDLYTQKLGRVVSIQRTVRREILSLDGQITDATMCKLERGYAAIMQDLSECAMNLERWVERSISRTISAEKIKQAFTSDIERTSLASTSFQNASLEVQFEELENSFHKLLEEVVRAQKGEGAKDPQAVTVMEVRAEYEDKLNRMKAKMKQLYQEQIQVFKDKQKEDIATLERELQKTKDKLSESSRAYEEHIKALTTELWSVGEKFLIKKDEAEWLRKKQKSGSLMSLQHMHSSGLGSNQEEPPSRPSDTYSLRSLPMHHGAREKRENRALHMSDEEGEVFDNRWLKELSTPRRDGPSAAAPGQRLSELKWRNSLCPPHLKSSYPAETQFTQAIDEDEIKCTGATGTVSRQQRKEVGITAYKKPGPPTPSKQAGRLSATDSELRESLRPEPEAAPSRKTNTPSRLRALFRSAKNDTPVEASPRRKLSNIFRKK